MSSVDPIDVGMKGAIPYLSDIHSLKIREWDSKTPTVTIY
jgi:hypothetical protein